MRYGVCVPNLDEFVDARRVGELARCAEQTGWDGFFLWDHVVFPHGGTHQVADPWVLLTVAALATERIRLGPLVTPVARRRPGTLARQTTSLDRLSKGRLVLGAGLGFTLEDEFGTWGEPIEPKVVAHRLDQALALLAGLWTGEPVADAANVTFQPTPVQRPRPPVWIGCNWPAKAPLRRAARWDGVVPMIVDFSDGSFKPTPQIVDEILAGVHAHRTDPAPFDVVITGRTTPEDARGIVEPLAEAGATWWLEGFRPAPGEYDAALRRIEAGPPR